jgi:LPS export ABC transporter protein LptC
VKNIYEQVRRLPGNRLALWSFVIVSLSFIFFIVLTDEREFRRDFSISKTGSYMEGFRIVSKKDGADAWIISARRADFSRDDTLARMETVTIDIKKEGAVLNADHGTYNMNTKDLALEDNVTLKIKDSVISTKNLSWNHSRGILSAEGEVRMEGNKFFVEGDGLTATEDNKVKLMRNVKATFY